MKARKKNAKPQVESTMTMVLFESGVKFDSDDACGLATRMELSESVFERSKQAAQQAGLSLPAFIEQALQEKAARLRQPKQETKSPNSVAERCCPSVLLYLSVAENKALGQWLLNFGNSTAADVARFAMSFALIHPEKFTGWLAALTDYCQAEDMTLQLYTQSRIAARYRTNKLKLSAA